MPAAKRILDPAECRLEVEHSVLWDTSMGRGFVGIK
jgi:hypothetical protein